MSGKKISALVELAAEPAVGDQLTLVDVSEPAAEDKNKYLLWSTIEALLLRVNGANALTANWAAGAFTITAKGFEIPDKVRMFYDSGTGEYGLQIKLTNKTGGVTTKGYLASPSNATANAFVYTPTDVPDIFGIIYEGGVADSEEAWVWIQGVVQIYFVGTTTLAHFARSIVAADGGASGQAASEAVPGSPFAVDKHFQEIGHVVEAREGAGLAKCVIHFN